MKTKQFNLKPFAIHPGLETLQIQGEVGRAENRLRVHFEVSANLEDFGAIALAAPDEPAQRLDNLWQTTCFEFFLTAIDSSCYWEFNLSPAGHWNVYRFQDYRQRMQLETAFNDLSFNFILKKNSLELDLVLDLQKLDLAQKTLNIGVTTVIADKSGHISHWAIAHPGQVPDFHDRASFLLQFS
jgi:hypothetical protein